MSHKLPDGITREHILAAIRKIEAGKRNNFADSTGYDVLFEGKRFPPKAVVGVAAEILLGEKFSPSDFSGGLRSKCFRILAENQFEIVTKGDRHPFPDEVVNNEFREGAVQTVMINRYERDTDARRKCIEIHGSVCKICSFDFSRVYGTIGDGFIHVHHLTPLSDIDKEYVVDPDKHLIPVCPNCHAMLHKRTPPFSPTELRGIIESDK